MFLDCKLNFEEHLKTIVNRINKTIGLLRKFRTSYQGNRYLQYVNPLSDHTLIILTLFTTNTSFHQKLEALQYNAALAIAGAIPGTSKEKLYNKLGLESL